MRWGLLSIAGAAVLAFAPGAWAAECAPQRMVRVVFRNATPGIDPASFAARPKTMYRLGERYGRVEEEANPAARRQALVIVSEPDVWFVNRLENKGQHIVDPGPVLEFRAPIFAGADVPPVFRKLETGCELDFLETYAPRPVGQVKVEGVTLDRHQVSLGPDRIEILLRPEKRQVFSVARYRDDQPRVVLRYLDYAVDLAPDMALFAKPEGVTFTEAAGQAPPAP